MPKRSSKKGSGTSTEEASSVRFVLPGDSLEFVDSAKRQSDSDGIFHSESKVASASTSGLFDGRSVTHWRKKTMIPSVGQTAIVQITRLTQRMAFGVILCVDNEVLSQKCRGIIRKENVRQLDTDSVEMWRCFRPSDIVRAEIISLGNQRDYYLSTSRVDLGVVLAHSEMGHRLKAVSWKSMQCTVTKRGEPRKVAKN